MNKDLMKRSFNFDVRAEKNEKKYTLTGVFFFIVIKT